MPPLRPATTADAAILALHHHQTLIAQGRSDAEATAMTGAFLSWARTELEAGRLIAVVVGDGLSAEGSAALHLAARPQPFASARLLYTHAGAPEVGRALIAGLLAEARLRGVTSLEASTAQVTGLGLEAGELLEWKL